jgi:hypothetical protein
VVPPSVRDQAEHPLTRHVRQYQGPVNFEEPPSRLPPSRAAPLTISSRSISSPESSTYHPSFRLSKPYKRSNQDGSDREEWMPSPPTTKDASSRSSASPGPCTCLGPDLSPGPICTCLDKRRTLLSIIGTISDTSEGSSASHPPQTRSSSVHRQLTWGPASTTSETSDLLTSPVAIHAPHVPWKSLIWWERSVHQSEITAALVKLDHAYSTSMRRRLERSFTRLSIWHLIPTRYNLRR